MWSARWSRLGFSWIEGREAALNAREQRVGDGCLCLRKQRLTVHVSAGFFSGQTPCCLVDPEHFFQR